MKKHTKIISLILAAALLASLFTGCGSAKPEFQIMFAAPFVNEELVATYDAQVPKEGELPLRVSAFSFGSEELDAMIYASGIMAMSAMLAAGELDVLICNLEDAARYARSGSFYDLADVFTQEELAEFGDSLLSFNMIDAEGNLTDEQVVRCGLDLSGRDSLTTILGDENYGVFIVFSADDLELAKDTVRKLFNAA